MRLRSWKKWMFIFSWENGDLSWKSVLGFFSIDCLPTDPLTLRRVRKFSKIFGSVRKCSENFGNPRKIFECNRRFMKLFYIIPISDTCGLKIRFKNFNLWFALVLRFLHWYYSLIALLSANQNRAIFSCMFLSNMHTHIRMRALI